MTIHDPRVMPAAPWPHGSRASAKAGHGGDAQKRRPGMPTTCHSMTMTLRSCMEMVLPSDRTANNYLHKAGLDQLLGIQSRDLRVRLHAQANAQKLVQAGDGKATGVKEVAPLPAWLP